MRKLLSITLALLLATAAQAVDTVSWAPEALTTANTAKDGTGAVAIVFEATETTYVDRLVWRATGSNTASVGRVFLNNGGNPAIAANNVLFAEITLDSTTLSEVAALADESLDLKISLPPGYRIMCTLGTTVAAGWRVTAVCKTPNQIAE